MNRRDNWMNNTKNKLDSFLHRQALYSTQSSDKLPPRLQKHGISIAARVVGNGIRNFTKRTTGKDLAQLRNSRTRQVMLTKLSAIRVAITNKQTHYNLLSLACATGSNLVTSLSPEGPECDYNFKKDNFMREFIAKYYEQCSGADDFQTVPEPKLPVMKRKLEKLTAVAEEQKPKINNILQCRCNTPLEEKKSKNSSFLGCWHHKGINESELENYLNENVAHFTQENKKELHKNKNNDNEWSRFLDNENYVVFRRRLKSGLYEYRIQASFPDISAHKLFQTQIDGQYRKQWDEYVLELNVVDSNNDTSTDLVHWVTKCPYPFSTREYIYLRRKKIDVEKKYMLLYSEATDNTDIPKDKKIHRVDKYVSKLIIRPHHETFDQVGCDFLLTYYDDPKMMLPTSVLDLAASRGIADSMLRMYQAANQLNEKHH